MKETRRWVLIFLTITLGGCTMTKSNRIEPSDRYPNDNSLSASINYTTEVKKQFQQKLLQQERLVANGRLGIIGGTIVAAISTIYQAHRDTTIGFGLLGTSSYALANLYAPNIYSEIYEAGLDSVQCLISFAEPVAMTMPLVQKSQSALDSAVATLSNIGISGSNQEQRARQVLETGKKTSERAIAYLSREPLLAKQIMVATDEAVNLANKQIRSNSPNLEAFANVGKSLISTAGSIPTATTQQAIDGKFKPNQNAPLQNESQISAAIEAVENLETNLRIQLDSYDKFGSLENLGCINRAKVAGPKPLEITGLQNVSLTVGDKYNIHAFGGRPPYTGRWIGNEPSDIIECVRPPYSGTDFECIIKKPYNNLTYKYRIFDNEGNSKEVSFSYVAPLNKKADPTSILLNNNTTVQPNSAIRKR